MSIASVNDFPRKGTVTGEPLPIDTKNYEVQVIKGVAERIHTVVVHRFKVSDAEDPILYAAKPLLDWEQSEQGKWIMAHAMETPVWHQQPDMINWGHQFVITAKLRGRDYTYWVMKWNSQ